MTFIANALFTICCTLPAGREYYHNLLLGSSQWEEPVELRTHLVVEKPEESVIDVTEPLLGAPSSLVVINRSNSDEVHQAPADVTSTVTSERTPSESAAAPFPSSLTAPASPAPASPGKFKEEEDDEAWVDDEGDDSGKAERQSATDVPVATKAAAATVSDFVNPLGRDGLMLIPAGALASKLSG